jgi:hypothetical protein
MRQLHRRLRLSLFLPLLLVFPLAAAAQQRPLVTEDPETIGAGRVLVEGGLEYDRNAQFPVSGVEGHLLKFPLLGVSVGISSIAEIQIDGGIHDRLAITKRDPSAPLAYQLDVPGNTTGDVDDIVIGTKVRLVPEGMVRPSFGFRFATRLPNANNETAIGLDTTDFYASILIAKTVQSVRIVGNLGLGILGDPVRGDRQNDVTLYGLSFARAITNRAEVVGEINGWINTRAGVPPPGTDSRGMARFGGRYTIGSWRADAAVLFGVTSRDPNLGVAAGFTYVFNAFKVP